MTREKADKVYDVLVRMGGADEMMRESFVHHHLGERGRDICNEWRFGGKLGFGGKYRSVYNAVDCYSEDSNSRVMSLIESINQELKTIE